MTVGIIRIEGPYTTAERDALTGMPTLMMIFNSDNLRLEVWDGAAWQPTPGQDPAFRTITTDSGFQSVFQGEVAVEQAFSLGQSADIASANDIALTGANANIIEITGSTQLNRFSVPGPNPLILMFTSTPTIKHNQAAGGGFYPIHLAGAVDFVATAGDTLTLLFGEIGGTLTWREIGRAVI